MTNNDGAAPAAARRADVASFFARIENILGKNRISTDMAARRLYSTDFSEIELSTAIAVIRPRTTQDVSSIIRAAAETGVALTARGGGMSYTLGYVPRDENTAVLDMTDMKAIRIRADDRLIEIEPGATWAQVHEALRPTGLRIGCMGTMSGIAATVGGGLGNNATGHGRGDITDDLMGLEAVLGDGSVILTGALATNPQHPVLRSYGPDLTGVFTHDAGVFGIKTKAVFRLQPKPGGVAFVCYGFSDSRKLVRALCEVEKLDVMASNMAFSHYHHRLFASLKPAADEAKLVGREVMQSARSKLRALSSLAALARPGGFKYLLKWPFSTFGVIDAYDQATADKMARDAGAVMRRHGGIKLPSSLGVAFRAQPYMPIERLMIGVDGECTIPTNCGVVLSQSEALLNAVEGFFSENEAAMSAHGVTWTRLFLTSKGGFGMEPILYWNDRPSALRMAQLSPERRAEFESKPENKNSRDFALDLRRRLVERVDALHPYHFQIGKYYDYRSALQSDAAWQTLVSFKDILDPAGLMNPGGLGLR
ncbi:FAD-binding oxidoreductase [Hyphococcus sp.]|uniref:FAD-binding oxidoreductase n=1 Tax=Hyphococcus sp. TaxID=2038636 RepID=UPI003D10980E